jgi:hypothetical protein
MRANAAWVGAEPCAHRAAFRWRTSPASARFLLLLQQICSKRQPARRLTGGFDTLYAVNAAI